MWLRVLFVCLLLEFCGAAPHAHINRLALFPDKSAWCEAKNITQIVGHTGCTPRSIQNRSHTHTLLSSLGNSWMFLWVRLTKINIQLLNISILEQCSNYHACCGLCRWFWQCCVVFLRACLGQCFSYSVPNTFPQSTESLVHCDSCMPAQTQWEVVSVSSLISLCELQTRLWARLKKVHAKTTFLWTAYSILQ